jgi:hypothetical protein
MNLQYKIALSLIALLGAIMMIQEWRSSRQRQAQLDQAVAEWPKIENNCAVANALYTLMRQQYVDSLGRAGPVPDDFSSKSDEFDRCLRTAGEAATRLYRENPVFASAVREALRGQQVGPTDTVNPCAPELRSALSSRFSKAGAK